VFAVPLAPLLRAEIEVAIISGGKKKRLHRQQKAARFGVRVEVEIG
jgi:hypothetical protein